MLQIYITVMFLVDVKKLDLVHENKDYLLITVSLVVKVSASMITEQEVSGSCIIF